ncbi:TPA: hypothetical protein ACH3X2_005901 [Trebouxia sp. C0005]
MGTADELLDKLSNPSSKRNADTAILIMRKSDKSGAGDNYFLTSIIVTKLPHLVEDPDMVEFLVRDVLVAEGPSVWETSQGLHNVLHDNLLDLGLCSSDLKTQLLCEDLLQAYHTPSTQTVRLCRLLEQGNTLSEALITSQLPEIEDQVPPGTCALCERLMPLTWHHLYPKEMQKKFLKRGLMTEEDKNSGIRICRQCHNAIHRLFDNELLAKKLHSVESLMQEESIQKWVAYASKQKAHAVIGHRVSR